MGMQHDIINDRIDVVSKGFLGLTVTCARCHDHKFDPIPTKDYYSLHGIFASSAEPRAETVVSKIIPTSQYNDYYKQRVALDKKQDDIEERIRANRRQRNADLNRQLQREMRETVGQIARLEMTHSGAPMRANAIQDVARPKDSPVFIRGEAENRGAVVPRRFLELVSGTTRPAFTNGSGRLELAHSIVAKNNPLTPRVMINRIWQHHFGEGFVPTPDDFGTMSELPSHPELLDYLASRFQEENWSIKKIHRLIMLSSVYQQSSANNPRYAQVDPNNRLLWRANIRRLEVEALRDSFLAIGGSLDRTMYGRPVDLERNPDSTRRTIYARIDRQDVIDEMVNFDFANPDMPNGKRYETTVPQQALFLMNSPVVVEQAKKLVSLKEFSDCIGDEARVNFLYERIYQRPPREEELKLAIDFVSQAPEVETTSNDGAVQAVSNDRRPLRQKQFAKQQQQRMERSRGGSGSQKRAPLTVWQEYAHALMQANEASFVN
jgi:hypothetical protein